VAKLDFKLGDEIVGTAREESTGALPRTDLLELNPIVVRERIGQFK